MITQTLRFSTKLLQTDFPQKMLVPELHIRKYILMYLHYNPTKNMLCIGVAPITLFTQYTRVIKIVTLKGAHLMWVK